MFLFKPSLHFILNTEQILPFVGPIWGGFGKAINLFVMVDTVKPSNMYLPSDSSWSSSELLSDLQIKAIETE